MKSVLIVLSLGCLISISLTAQDQTLYFQIDTAPGPNPWSSLDMNDHPAEFQFAIISDRTGGHRPGVFEEAIDKLNLLQPEFVVCVGDLIEGYTEDTAVLNAEWDEMEGFTNKLTMPFFYVAGNHDLSNEMMGKIWAERFGRTYYHFVYKDVLFLLLNSEDQYRGSGRGTISDQQFAYVEKTLAENRSVKHTLVFMHQPLWSQEDAAKWPEIEEILAERQHTVFVGHKHGYVKYERNNGRYFILATTGGGSLLNGPDLGQFDQLVWVTMKNDGPILANLVLDGIHDEDVFTYEKKQFISAVTTRPPIRVYPLFVEDEDFQKGSVLIRLRNLHDGDMIADVTPGFGWDLVGSLGENLAMVPSGDSLVLDLQMTNRKGTAFDKIRPLPLQIGLQFEAPGVGHIQIPHKFLVKPLPKRYIEEADGLIVDGDLSDWPSLPMTCSHPNQSDNQVFWNVQMDHAYLYLGAKILDDTLIVDPKLPSWKQDGFGWELSLGSGNDIAGRISAKQFRINPSFGAEDQRTYRGEQWPSGLEFIAKGHEGGYQVELKLPLSMLRPDWELWKQLRINFFVDDKDGLEDPVRIRWRPEWRSAANVLGSGIFFRK